MSFEVERSDMLHRVSELLLEEDEWGGVRARPGERGFCPVDDERITEVARGLREIGMQPQDFGLAEWPR